MGKIASDEDVDHLNISVCDSILEAAKKSIKRKGGKPNKKSMVDYGL